MKNARVFVPLNIEPINLQLNVTKIRMRNNVSAICK